MASSVRKKNCKNLKLTPSTLKNLNNSKARLTICGGLFRTLYLFLVIFLTLPLQVVTAQLALPTNNSKTVPLREVQFGVILAYVTNRPHPNEIPFSMEISLPAIKYAVEKIEADSNSVLPGVKFVINEADSNCSNFEGPLAAIDMYWNKRAHLFLGPACAFPAAPVARYSGEWGIPVITAGALYDTFTNKSQFKSLTRVHGSFKEVADVLATVLHHFNWTRIGMLFCDDIRRLDDGRGECLHILRPVYRAFAMKQSEYIQLEKSEMNDWKLKIAEMSNKSRTRPSLTFWTSLSFLHTIMSECVAEGQLIPSLVP